MGIVAWEKIGFGSFQSRFYNKIHAAPVQIHHRQVFLLPYTDADSGIFLQKVIIASVITLPGISGKRRHQYGKNAPLPAFPDITQEIRPISLLRLQALQFLVIMGKLNQQIIA